MAAERTPGSGESGHQVATALGEVGPAVVVDGNHPAGAEDARGLGGLGAVEDDECAAEEDGEAWSPGEKDGGVHRAEALGDLLDQVELSVVAADKTVGRFSPVRTKPTT